ncbi:MAG: ABC transporter ATP-binding protein, partial [Nitrospinales bacterium]
MTNAYEESLQGRYYDWPLFNRILAYLKPYASLVAISIILLFGVSLLNLAGPYLTKIAIDDYIKVSNYDGLDRIALIFLIVLALAFILQFCQTMLMQYIGQNVMLDLRRQVFAHLHKMSFKFFDRNPVGKMITRVVNDVETLNEMLTSGLILVFSDLFTLVGITGMLFYLDWRLTLMVCLVFPLLFLATRAYRRRAKDAFRKNRAHITELNSFLQENLAGMY